MDYLVQKLTNKDDYYDFVEDIAKILLKVNKKGLEIDNVVNSYYKVLEDRELSVLDGETEYENEFGIGDICLDYNDTELKILNIGTYDEVIQDLSKSQLAEVGKFPVDDLKKSDKVYLVKVNKSNDHVPVKEVFMEFIQ
jgi:hypothetical protein